MNPEIVEVTQEDDAAAAEIIRVVVNLIRAGKPISSEVEGIIARHHQAALTAARPALVAWQPIETVPTMQEVDIWIEGIDGDGWRVTGEVYSTQEPMWIKTEMGNYFPHENGGFPTHWQPLPAPPATAIRAAGVK